MINGKWFIRWFLICSAVLHVFLGNDTTAIVWALLLIAFELNGLRAEMKK